VWIALHSLLKH